MYSIDIQRFDKIVESYSNLFTDKTCYGYIRNNCNNTYIFDQENNKIISVNALFSHFSRINYIIIFPVYVSNIPIIEPTENNIFEATNVSDYVFHILNLKDVGSIVLSELTGYLDGIPLEKKAPT